MLAAVTALWKREIVKFVRDRSRVVGALAQPLGFWLLLGLGFQDSFQMPSGAPAGVDYLEYLFPGMVALILLFTAVFATISIVEERRSGFLQAFLVAPVSRSVLVLGNVLGGTTLAVLQALLFWLLIPLLGLPLHLVGLLLAATVCFLTGLAFTALGFAIAWRMESTRGFHAVMNLFLLPLWFLSGAVFPPEGASPVLRALTYANPVYYAVSALRDALYWPDAPFTEGPSLPLALTVSLGFTAFLLAWAVLTVRRSLFDAR